MAPTRRRSPELLAAYVPRVALLWDELGDDRAWRTIDGSLVFVDISGFTALSEKLARRGRVGAEELTNTLSACFGDLLKVAYDAGGSLLKFGGDALLLLFEGDGHPQRACATALAMRATMAAVGKVTTSVGTFRLRMSVGVHSGRLDLFRVGRSHRELIVTGPGATATVTMENTADAGEIVISPATAERIHPVHVGRAKGPGFLLRNRTLPLPEGLATQPLRAFPSAPDSIPTALRDELLAGRVESQHRNVSIAFVHFDDVDGLMATDGPAAVAAGLDELMTIVQDAAEESGVTFLGSDVDRDGGKIILVAGAPRALGDDEERLLRAVRRIADHRGRLAVRIGVNRGHVFAGEVGPPFRRTYTVMGDAVNLAARLMAKASAGEVLATRDVLDRSATAFDATAVAPFTVKGKSQPVQAFVLGRQGERGERRIDGSDPGVPLVGRADEIRALLDAVDAARTGQGSVIDIAGAAGIGKSRLIAEMTAGASDMTTIRAFCEPCEARTPYFAFRFILRGLLGIRDGGAAGGRRLHDIIAASAPHLAPWSPLIADVADVEVEPTPAASALEARFRPERTATAVVELLASTTVAPALIVIEDAQWLDPLSARLIAAVARAAPRRPWVVCLARREEVGSYEPDASFLTLSLRPQPLPDEDARRIVSAVASGEPLLPHERDAIIATAAGNPLFLTELLKARSGRAPDEPLPDSVEAVVAIEIDRLPPEDRRVLRYLSVLGVTFDGSLVGEVTDGAIRTSTAALRRFSSFLETAGPGVLRFRNHCYRQVAYDALPFARRRELHELVGDALERKGDLVGDRAGTVSFHYFHARRYDRCWVYARLAAADAMAKYANTAALELYERALAAAARLGDVDSEEVARTWEAAGDVAMLLGDFSRARHSYGRARAAQATNVAAVALLCGRLYRAAVHLRQTQATRWLCRGLRLLDGDDRAEALTTRAELRLLYAHARLEAGRPREALRWARLGSEDAVRACNQRRLVDGYLVQDWALAALGRVSEATNGERALAICEELGEPALTARVLVYLGNMAFFAGRWDDAVEQWRRSGELYRRCGNSVDAATGDLNTVEILVLQGRLQEAEEPLADIVDLWRSMGYGIGLAFALNHQGKLALHRGETEKANGLFAEAKAACGPATDTPAHLEADAWLAECALRDGRVADGLDLADAALAREAATGDSTYAPMLHRLRGCALVALDRSEEAWKAFDQSLTIGRARGAAYEIALTLDTVATVSQQQGLPADPAATEERDRLLARLGVLSFRRPPLAETVAITLDLTATDIDIDIDTDTDDPDAAVAQ